MMKGRRIPVVLALLFPVAVSGCGGGPEDRPETVPAEGTVVYKDNPVEGALVAFMAEGSPRAASGTTDAEGKFKLSTFEFQDGAIVGTHKITVNLPKAAGGGGDGDPGTDIDMASPDAMKVYMDMMEKAEAGEHDGLLPEKYASTASTPLEETVTAEGPNTFVLQLVD